MCSANVHQTHISHIELSKRTTVVEPFRFLGGVQLLELCFSDGPLFSSALSLLASRAFWTPQAKLEFLLWRPNLPFEHEKNKKNQSPEFGLSPRPNSVRLGIMIHLFTVRQPHHQPAIWLDPHFADLFQQTYKFIQLKIHENPFWNDLEDLWLYIVYIVIYLYSYIYLVIYSYI